MDPTLPVGPKDPPDAEILAPWPYKKGVPLSAHLRVSEHTVDCLLEKLFGNKVDVLN